MTVKLTIQSTVNRGGKAYDVRRDSGVMQRPIKSLVKGSCSGAGCPCQIVALLRWLLVRGWVEAVGQFGRAEWPCTRHRKPWGNFDLHTQLTKPACSRGEQALEQPHTALNV